MLILSYIGAATVAAAAFAVVFWACVRLAGLWVAVPRRAFTAEQLTRGDDIRRALMVMGGGR